VTTPAERPAYPAAPRLDLVDDMHGVLVPDPYRWLEDDTDERTIAWVDTQRALMADERATWQSRDHFTERVEALLGAGTISPPYWRGERYFLVRREPGQQFSVLYAIDPALVL